MSGLRKILNPEKTKSPQIHIDEAASEEDSPLSTYSELTHPIPPRPDGHPPHPNCPDTLTCLPDTDDRPQHTLPVILRCAILGSPRQRLTIREIYAAMEEKYAYYRSAGPTWKQSVRHHLSLNRLFEKQPRPVTEPGFGSYWTVNLSAPPGTKRPRKRGKSVKDEEGEVQPIGPAKKRGRPRKAPTPTEPPPPTQRHIERLIPPPPPSDDEMETLDDCDEFESEEEIAYPYEHRDTIATMRARATSSARRMQQPSSDPSQSLLNHLQDEIAELRRQSAEAVSISLRLSGQLADAQAEVSRTRTALRTAESKLDEETRLRREAEYTANFEARLRKATEETLAAHRHNAGCSTPSTSYLD